MLTLMFTYFLEAGPNNWDSFTRYTLKKKAWALIQWSFQDPKMEVLTVPYFWPYFADMGIDWKNMS